VKAGTVAAVNIAALDPASGTWATLGSGVNGPVQALASAGNGDLLAGGNLDGLAQPMQLAPSRARRSENGAGDRDRTDDIQLGYLWS